MAYDNSQSIPKREDCSNRCKRALTKWRLKKDPQSRLQEYAQKVGISTPVYETIKEGPSHEPFFRSTVIVNDVRFESLPGFMNRKAAEQSAAEIALMELKKSGQIDESTSQPLHETGLCKNLLQEYAQKLNYAVPVYECRKEDMPGRCTMFSCVLDIGGIQYIGAAARTKKEAEIKAARTALLAIQTINPGFNFIGGSKLTVIPTRKRPIETVTKPEEKKNIKKAKKTKPKRPRKERKKLSTGITGQDQVDNTNKLDAGAGNQLEPKLLQNEAGSEPKLVESEVGPETKFVQKLKRKRQRKRQKKPSTDITVQNQVENKNNLDAGGGDKSEPKLLHNAAGPEPKLVQNEAGPESKLVQNDAGSEPKLLQNEAGSEPKLAQNEAGSEPKLVRNEAGLEPQLVRNEAGPEPKLVRNEAGSDPFVTETIRNNEATRLDEKANGNECNGENVCSSSVGDETISNNVKPVIMSGADEPNWKDVNPMIVNGVSSEFNNSSSTQIENSSVIAG
ncbi:hypothetical protein ACFE04_021878 [Oxalis oulophora]